MSRSDRERVTDALTHLAILIEHLGRGDLSDTTVADAVCLRLAAALDALAATSEAFRVQTFGDDWYVMRSTRNRIAHGYISIDMTLISATVENDIPGLVQQLRLALDGDTI